MIQFHPSRTQQNLSSCLLSKRLRESLLAFHPPRIPKFNTSVSCLFNICLIYTSFFSLITTPFSFSSFFLLCRVLCLVETPCTRVFFSSQFLNEIYAGPILRWSFSKRQATSYEIEREKNVVESRKTDQPKGIEMNCSDIPPLFNKSIKRLSKGFRFFDAFFLFQHHSIIFLSPVSSYTHKILIIFQVKERGALLWGCQCICLDFFPSVFFSFFGLSSILMCRLFTAAIFNNNSRTVF